MHLFSLLSNKHVILKNEDITSSYNLSSIYYRMILGDKTKIQMGKQFFYCKSLISAKNTYGQR